MNATLSRLSRLTRDPLPAADGPLLDAFLAGDQAAFAALVRRHAGLVFATCRRILQHQQDAEDAFQATFLVLARRAADVWPREAVGSWLFGVAHRVALKARAVRARRSGRENPLEDVPNAERPAPDFDLAEAVQRVVLKLPAAYRAAVVACDLEGLSRKDAAERLGWSEGTLSGRLARARALLADRLRRSGLSLPASGLAALVGTSEALSAKTLHSTIELATGIAAAPAPVATLTEGVVRSMALYKLKAMTAVVLTACAIGFGAFAAAGTGVGVGADDGQKQPQRSGGSTAPGAGRAVDPPKVLVPQPVKPVTDRDRLQGTWRVVALTENEKTTPTNPKDPWVIELNGNILRMPYLEGGASNSTSTEGATGTTTSSGSGSTSGAGGSTTGSSSSGTTTSGSGAMSGVGWKQREYTFAVDETKTPRTIDMFGKKKGSFAHGIYEFTAPAKTCQSCHTEAPQFRESARIPLPENALGICGPGLKTADFGVRLAISIDGKRPAKFGGAGVIIFTLARPDPQTEELARLTQEQKRLEAALREAAAEDRKLKLDAERKLIQRELDELIIREEQRKAQEELRRAQVQLERSKARAEEAQVDYLTAVANFQRVKEKLAAVEKALADAKKSPPPTPAKAGDVFTVHVRTLNAAEKVIRVKATGKETVLEGLVYAADDVPIKSDGVSVWVVRDKAILSVDLPAITKGGDAKTNYALKAGDQLFVQMKPSK